MSRRAFTSAHDRVTVIRDKSPVISRHEWRFCDPGRGVFGLSRDNHGKTERLLMGASVRAAFSKAKVIQAIVWFALRNRRFEEVPKRVQGPTSADAGPCEV